MNRYVSEAAKLPDAVKSGDFKSQFGTVAKTCDNCHDDFRSK